jgi:hypothetical protein
MKHLEVTEPADSPQLSHENFGILMDDETDLLLYKFSESASQLSLGIGGTIAGTSAGNFRGIVSEGVVPF